MLKLSTSLLNIPIISLRTGGQIGVAMRPVINPNNLKIEGWFSLSRFDEGLLVLPTSEIREVSRLGIAVNDQDAISPADELVRLLPLIRLNYQLEGKGVVTDTKKKIGKIMDYATDLESFYIQKLYASPGILKALTKDQITIARSQVLEITDKKIIISDLGATEKAYFTAPVQAQ